MGTSITFKRPDGKDADGYLANAARGNAPGVVVIQEWWGLQDQIKGMCDRFAVAGFDALAPDLYNGTVVPYHDTDAAGKEMNSLDFLDATDADRARCRAISVAQRRQGRAHRLLPRRRGDHHRRHQNSGACGRRLFYGIPPEPAAKPADVKIPLQAPFRQQGRLVHAAGGRCLRAGHEGRRQVARTVPL